MNNNKIIACTSILRINNEKFLHTIVLVGVVVAIIVAEYVVVLVTIIVSVIIIIVIIIFYLFK